MQLKHLLSVSMLLPLGFFGVTAQTVTEVNKDSFYESYSDNVDVSGSVLASSLVAGSINRVSPEQLHVFIPTPHPILNITLASIDGKYSADATVTLDENQTGWIRIKLPTDYQSEYEKYLPNKLVAFVFSDSTDMFGNYIQEVFATSWGAPISDEITLLINSAGTNPNITFKEQGGEVITIDCSPIIAKFTRVFNHTCRFGHHIIDGATVVTFSPEYDSSGKDFVIWPLNE